MLPIKQIDTSWIKLSRKLRDSAIYKDSQAVHLWVHILLSANHSDNTFLHGETVISVKAGQLLTGRKSLSKQTGINESKVERLLKLFEKTGQIEQQKTNKYRVISITNYQQHQKREQQLNNKRTTTEQQLNTNNNGKKDKEVKEVISYLNEKANRSFKNAECNAVLIRARISEGSTVDEIKKVIDSKVSQWMGNDKMDNYLRPKTLFSATNFNQYVGQLGEQPVYGSDGI